jgi:hypothetical protein
MEPSTLSPDAYRLVRTMQVFGQWQYRGWDAAQRELLENKLARLDITRTRLVLTERGRSVPRCFRLLTNHRPPLPRRLSEHALNRPTVLDSVLQRVNAEATRGTAR